MSDTDVLTLATQAVLDVRRIDDSDPEVVARHVLEAVGLLGPDAQPRPTNDPGESVHDELVAWLQASPVFASQPELPALVERITGRKRIGLVKYGTTLAVENDRDPAGDMLDEQLDASLYAHQGFERARRRALGEGRTGALGEITWWGIRRNRMLHEVLAVLGAGNRQTVELRG